MASAEMRSLRPGRLEARRLVVALLISLLVHLGSWGGYELGKKYGWWQRLHVPAWLHKVEKKTPPRTVAEKDTEPPTVFVDVSQADPEPPKKAKFYSNKNAQAANPDAKKETEQPKLDGRQKVAIKTEDVPKLQPAAAPAPEQPTSPAKPAEETHPYDPLSLGDLKLRPPVEQKNEAQKVTETQPRPRTLAQARSQQQLPGPKMQLDGGVKRIKLIAAFDTKATAFGEYDAALYQAIQQYWQDELDKNNYAQYRTGNVTMKFTLHYDGSISGLEVANNQVGVLLSSYCENAIEQTAPYAKWPSDMLHAIGSTERKITLTFIYY